MARNEQRRRALVDGAITVLAEAGSRGLTHRAVDAAAAVPIGTTSNYFPTRSDLVAAIFGRISERLAPDPDVAARLAARPPTRALFADYMRDIVSRLTAERHVTLALFELRLESSRRPEVRAQLAAWLGDGLRADVAFNEAAGLPGGRTEIALFHYALDGLLLDRLTTPLDPDTSTGAIVDALVAGLLPTSDA